MSTTSIILLLLGIVIFVASFVLPEQKNKATESDHRLSEELVRETLTKEIDQAKSQIQDTVDETVSYSMEKTERAMERLTNEKIQAVNDYSDTVLEEIHKDHKEVLFLYDMLNDKQADLQKTVKEVNTLVKDAEDKVLKVAVSKTPVPRAKSKVTEKAAENPTEKITEKTKTASKTTGKKIIKKESGEKQIAEKQTTDFKPLQAEQVSDLKAINDIDVVVADGSKNNNEKILELHKAGKTNMVIAKELGLGVGEVKLVIDLFKSI